MTFAELSKILAAKNQRLPIDVPHPEKTTLGELIAVDQAGPRQFAYGTTKDYFLGFTAVDGEGTIFHGGGRVVKNAAGYNMTRLMAGSRDTLCILTQVTLMVRPISESWAIVPYVLPNLETAEKLLASLNKSQVRPKAVELESGFRTKVSLKSVEGRSPTCSTVLLVGFEGTAAETHWMVDTLLAEWNAQGIASHSFLASKKFNDAPTCGNDGDNSFGASSSEKNASLPDHEDAEINWRWLADFPADAQIAIRPSEVVEFIAAAREKFPEIDIRSHALSGVVFLAAEAGKTEDGEFYRQLRSLADSFCGKTTLLRKPENLELSREEIWGPPSDGFAVMRALKERFDPQNILNPGRFIFE
jgi:glycolate oxidase FAD binding subunit